MIKQVIQNFRSSKKNRDSADVILHIGAPKSGSSAIQRFCVSNREELLALGYFYPEHTLDKNGVSGGHTQVAGALVNGKLDLASVNFERLLIEAREHNACLLISAEGLYGQYEAMAKLCKGLRVRVVGFLRHPVEYLISNHNQGVKRHNSTARLGDLLPKLIGRQAGHLTGMPLIHWADAFGDENCCFLAYQSPSAGGAQIEGRFLEALGVPAGEVSKLLAAPQGITNRSYVKSALELKRLLNTVLDSLPAKVAHQVDWSLQGYSDEAINESGYTMADLTSEIRDLLEQQLLQQMEPVIERFPALVAAADVPAMSFHDNGSNWMDLKAPLSALENDAPEAMEEIRHRALTIRDEGLQHYSFLKLLDVLGIEFPEPREEKALTGLTSHQRTTLGREQAGDADCLRELAVLLERQGFLDDALFVISRALEKRPSGPGILRIKARIEKSLEVQRASTKASLPSTSKVIS